MKTLAFLLVLSTAALAGDPPKLIDHTMKQAEMIGHQMAKAYSAAAKRLHRKLVADQTVQRWLERAFSPEEAQAIFDAYKDELTRL
jgi:hypothetical protein